MTILALGFVMLAQVSVADKKQERGIFKCTNIKGAVYYNDRPCPVTDKEKKMRAVKDPLQSNSNVNTPAPAITTPSDKSLRFFDPTVDKAKLAEFRERIKAEEPPTQFDLEQLQAHERQLRDKFFPNQTDADDRRRAVNEIANREFIEAGNAAQHQIDADYRRRVANEIIRREFIEAGNNGQLKKDNAQLKKDETY